MEFEKLPKVTVISINTWDKNSGINTLTELFKYWDKDKVSQIYTRSDYPNTSVCNSFFQISENAVIRSVINRKEVGKRVYNSQSLDVDTQKAITEERNLYAKAHKKKSWLLTIVREVVWLIGSWKSKNLKEFLKDEKTDVFFVPLYPVVYMGWIQLFVLKVFPKPYVCYLADDNYSYLSCPNNILSYIHRFWLRSVVKKLAVNCNAMFVINATEARETDEIFGTKSVVLTKAINFDNIKFYPKIVNRPIRMVYAGKLVIGRASSLIEISKALSIINTSEIKVELFIYSQDQISKEMEEVLNANGSHFCGCINSSEVQRVLDESDIVVFVESLEKEYRYAARLSFSTKLTDYFRSGRCIFAIGDKSIAPIEYLRDNDAAIIATTYSEIYDNLIKIVERPQIITEYGKKAFDCGKRNHDERIIKKIFIENIVKAAKELPKI